MIATLEQLAVQERPVRKTASKAETSGAAHSTAQAVRAAGIVTDTLSPDSTTFVRQVDLPAGE